MSRRTLTDHQRLELAGATASATGPRCRCDRHINRYGTCNGCRRAPSNCRCLKLPK